MPFLVGGPRRAGLCQKRRRAAREAAGEERERRCCGAAPHGHSRRRGCGRMRRLRGAKEGVDYAEREESPGRTHRPFRC